LGPVSKPADGGKRQRSRNRLTDIDVSGAKVGAAMAVGISSHRVAAGLFVSNYVLGRHS
jgi:hypothetical protein